MKKQTYRKSKIVLMLVLLIVLSTIFTTVSWYTIKPDRQVSSENKDVMTPYFLYLLNPDDEKSLSVTIGNIHPGETKRMIFAVSSKKENFEIAKDNDFKYQLELAYTENLKVEYSVFSLKEEAEEADGRIAVYDETGTAVKWFSKKTDTPMTSTDVSADRQKEMYGENTAGIINLGKYELFEKDGSDDLHLVSSVDTEGNVTYSMDYYMIEIKWEDGINFNDYVKETDLVYIIVKALQPRPSEKQN